jgi:triosephosphate isomerase
MSTPIIIANWKMSLGVNASVKLALSVSNKLSGVRDKEVVLCPSFTSLSRVGEAIVKTKIKLGAQNVFWRESGAYTGEEAPSTLRELGCQYVIVGHCERRQNIFETDEMVHNKIRVCLENKLVPIVCVGETYAERQGGSANDAVFCQLIKALSGLTLSGSRQLVIAYEPVWVIGSGRAIDPVEAGKAFRLIHRALYDLWPERTIKKHIRIIYGGSVDAKNARRFSQLEFFSGFLVGGSSLKAEEFAGIIKAS